MSAIATPRWPIAWGAWLSPVLSRHADLLVRAAVSPECRLRRAESKGDAEMRRSLSRGRPSPAFVVSVLAVFVASTSAGYAAATGGFNLARTNRAVRGMTPIFRRGLPRAALAALIAMLLAGPAASPALARSGRIGYVGTIRRTHAFVAVVTHGSRVTAYVCDSRTIAQWFKGSLKAGKATLTSSDGSVLRVAIANGKADGSFRTAGAHGTVHRFSSSQAAKPAGLYRGVKTVAGKRYVGGWIVLPDGRQRGEVLTGATDVASPILDPSHPTVDIKKGKKRPLIIIIVILIGL